MIKAAPVILYSVIVIYIVGCHSICFNINEYFKRYTKTPVRTTETSPYDEYGRAKSVTTTTETSEPPQPDVTESAASIEHVHVLDNGKRQQLICHHGNVPKTSGEDWLPAVIKCAETLNLTVDIANCHIHVDNFKNCTETDVIDDMKYCLGKNHEIVEYFVKEIDKIAISASIGKEVESKGEKSYAFVNLISPYLIISVVVIVLLRQFRVSL